MKLHSDITIGDPIIADYNGELHRVTDVLYTFAGHELPKPAIEAVMMEPVKISDHKAKPLGMRWELSAIHQESASDAAASRRAV